MKFGKLKVNNFMSFTKETLDLSQRGMFLVEGEVIFGSGAFDSNGSGKTTLFVEALVWVLFGTTVKGDSKEEVVKNFHAGGRNCKVSLDILMDDAMLRVVRYRADKKNSNDLILSRINREGKVVGDLTASSKALTQSSINSLLGFDFKSFSNSVVFGQGLVDRFSTDSVEGRMAILEELLDLGYISDGYNNTKDALDVVRVEIDSVRNLQASFQGRIEYGSDELERLLTDRERWERERLENILEDLGSCCESESQYDNVVSDHGDKHVRLTAELSKIQGMVKSISNDVVNLESQIQEDPITRISVLNEKISDLYSRRKSLNDRLKFLEKNIGGICDRCGNKVSRASIKAYRNDISGEVNGIGKQVREFQTELTMCQGVITRNHKVRERLTNVVEVLENNRRKSDEIIIALEDIKQSYSTLTILSADIDRSFMSLKKHRVGKFRGTGNVELLTRKLNRERVILYGLNDLEEFLLDRFNYYKFWREAFSDRGIKSLVVSSIIPYLNERANYYSQIMTNGELVIEFDTKTTLKKGGEKSKLHVKSYRTSGGGSYRSISGGEKRRADICQCLALRDLVVSRGSKEIKLLILDEIFESLDKAGTERVILLLSELTKSNDSVYIITHSADLKDHFDNRLTVINESGNSRLVKESEF